MIDPKSEIENFKKRGYELIDHIVRYLESSNKGDKRVLDYQDPKDEYEFWKEYTIDNFRTFHEDLFNKSIRLHHPNYMGHQVSAPNLEIALLGLTSDLMNNGMGIYEMGGAAVAMEHTVINIFSAYIGYDISHSNGFMTSGGTLANLTALLAARAKCKSTYQNIQNNDLHIIVSEQAHFCIERAWLTMGLSVKNIHKIKVNAQFQIETNHVQKVHSEITQNQGRVVAVVGCACSTATGSYDDINWLGSFCAKHDLWFHVDGAHGGAAIFSDKLKKRLLSGVERADSIIIDAHKMMLTPALATAVVFKNYLDSYSSFREKADYLFNQSEIDPNNLAKRTYETTKYMMSIKLYYLFKRYGTNYIAEYVERQYNLTGWLHKRLEANPHFEVAHRPQSNILCFRFISCQDPNTFNRRLRDKLLSIGEFYIVSTILNNHFYLRVTLMNQWTQKRHLDELINHISNTANKIQSIE